ncbi:hypothetical protein GTW51_19185 [Aurantimonas aggregata]|uniref:Uncharacterized protein n=1 Tax=Aurantimonas aggregata TaxID=2047720 RepID=A0A6L9MM94_9HYPH|nr:hypothetical protein [Aurantimonas aggregata]NDV88822.1 hypothetical protein [Aurantimonas aggregata]
MNRRAVFVSERRSADRAGGDVLSTPIGLAADEPHQIVVAAALARDWKGDAQVHMIATELCHEIIKIDPEAPDACDAKRVHCESVIEKVSKRLDKH